MPPVDSNRSDPNRRWVLAAGLAGITSTVLPAATAAASGDQMPQGFDAPTGVTAVPIGYVSSGSTGEIRVSWNGVTGATGYEVARTFDGTTETVTVVGGATTTTDLIGLAGVDGTHAVVVRALAGSTRSGDSLEASTSAVIADGGVVTTIAGTPTYVLHTFAYDAGSPTATLTLRRTIDLEYLLVGGGGGGGAGYTAPYQHAGGGGGGGGVATGGINDADGEFEITVGSGGDGLVPDTFNPSTAKEGGDTTLTDGVTTIVAEGGGGGQRGFLSTSNPLGGAGGPSGAPTVFNNTERIQYHGTGGSGSGEAGSTGFGGGGAGGAGASSSITGPAVVYGGGGGGGTPDGTAGTGGSGGGGTGGRNNGTGTSQASPTAGTDGRGGGGGGGNSGVGSSEESRTGARGGHGVVLVRYALP